MMMMNMKSSSVRHICLQREINLLMIQEKLKAQTALKCIHCNKKCTSKQQLNYHHNKACPGVLDINGKPSQLKLYPSMASGGDAAVRESLGKHGLWVVCEPQESDQPASFGEEVFLHDSP
ncbi:unnamed protein product [Sphagnum jensenii]|uniref:C2H2-type domain-containing protein n=1 Tax=Sphagnum jensenii TaxID=128206 RepID=A0ABP1BB31_9BRYO